MDVSIHRVTKISTETQENTDINGESYWVMKMVVYSSNNSEDPVEEEITLFCDHDPSLKLSEIED